MGQIAGLSVWARAFEEGTKVYVIFPSEKIQDELQQRMKIRKTMSKETSCRRLNGKPITGVNTGHGNLWGWTSNSQNWGFWEKQDGSLPSCCLLSFASMPFSQSPKALIIDCSRATSYRGRVTWGSWGRPAVVTPALVATLELDHTDLEEA